MKKYGKVFKRFQIKGKKLVFRAPCWEDWEGYRDLINALVEERSDFLVGRMKDDEDACRRWGDVMTRYETDVLLFVVVEVDGEFGGHGTIYHARKTHKGTLGIGFKNKFTGLGIGQRMMKFLCDQAEKMKALKLVYLDLLATNPRAFHVYQKAGFEEVGRIPKKIHHLGRYTDQIMMIKKLKRF